MRTENEMIAYALEVQPELLPYIPELLADLDDLGSDAKVIVELVASLDLPTEAQVLDLGCGKGAVSVAIAEDLGLHVLGIDLFEPFIGSANEAAEAAGVAHLCTFRQADILKVVDEIAPVEVAVFAALGDVLGPLDETVGLIRRPVQPGGHYIVNDSYLNERGSASYGGTEGYASHEETLRRLASSGDVVLREIREPLASVVATNAENNAAIRRRAQALAGRYPSLERALLGFVEDQALECDYMEKNLVSASWLIRRR